MMQPYIPRPLAPCNRAPVSFLLPYSFGGLVTDCDCTRCNAWHQRGYDLLIIDLGFRLRLSWRLSRN